MRLDYWVSHSRSDSIMCVFEQFDPELSSRQFGVEVSRLTNDERAVPLVVEKLINYIEMHGLYTEGIYRKSGSTNKIKELKQGLDTGEEWEPRCDKPAQET